MADLIQHGGDASGLLRQADRARHTAKAMGRNRVAIAGAGPTDGAGEDGPTGEREPARRNGDAERGAAEASV